MGLIEMWVDPSANVVYMKSLTDKYHIRFDSRDKGGCFRVKTERGIVKFLPHISGLYYINLADERNSKVLFVTTIHNRFESFTQQAKKGSRDAGNDGASIAKRL